jgi:CHAT domain-containing protein/tetratricopeptide (TPR) repeat protein
MGLGIADLQAMVANEPRRALELALLDAVAAEAGADAHRHAEALWVAGLAHRALGDMRAAMASHTAARVVAEPVDRALAARVAISLAFEIGHTGDIPAAVALLAAIEDDVDEHDLPGLHNQRGVFHHRTGRLHEAAVAYGQARDAATAAGDLVTRLKALVNLGAVESQLGRYDDARRVLLEAVELAFEGEQVSMASLALANLAYVETVEGNLPEAIDAYVSAEDGYRQTGDQADLPRLYADHASALADANLLDDAEHLIDRAVAISAAGGNDLEHAELLLVSAEIDLAKGQPAEAHVSAVDAVAAFTRQGRDSWLHVAERLRLRAEARLTPDEPGIAEGLVMNGRALAAGGWRSDALSSTLLAALLYVQHGRHDEARELLTAAGPEATRGRGADKVMLGRVAAMLATAAGDRRAARRAVSAGLRSAAASQAGLGSLEARSQAAHHGAELIELGARLAIEDGRPRELLHRIEAMRTMVWRAPLVRAPDDEAMAAALSELRRLSAAAGDPDAGPDERRAADRQRLRVEREIRTLSRRARGQRGEATTTEDAVADALGQLGERDLLAYANLTGRLWAVVARGGRTSLHDLGDVAALDEHLEVCAFALHRLNRVQGSDASRNAAAQLLDDAATSLADQLLPATVARSERPLVVVPTGALHGVPWTALAPLRDRPVSVSPSLSAWSTAAQAAAARGGGPRRDRPVAFVAGPALQFADAEITELARSYARSDVVASTDSTADGVVDLFGRCELVHLACHGAFRTDNPLFSTLAVGDGPLTVYDLERAAGMPEVVVLSACSVGTSAAINGGTLLGLSSALGAFGASDVIAPLTPVNDERVMAVMRRVHERLAAGAAPAAALAGAVDDEGRLDPVAAAFVVIGA